MNLKHVYLVILVFLNPLHAPAQIDLQCNGRDMHSIYLVDDFSIYRIDSVDTSPTNPVFVAPNILGLGGISINNNLDSLPGPQTMYWIGGGSPYHYWNGNGWTNTGNFPGSTGAVNPGGTADYIFNLDGSGGGLYRYDGSTNDTLLLSNLNTIGAAVFDIATDNAGNFYIFYTNNQLIIAYNPAGIPIDTFTTTGFGSGQTCGIAILGDRIYALLDCGFQGLYKGTRTGNNINFTLIKSLQSVYSDIATCPEAGLPLAVNKNPDQTHFIIYPNPARNFITIKLQNTTLLEITNQMGVIVHSIETTGLQEIYLDISEWGTGMYFATVFSEKNITSRKKLVVQ